MSGENEDNQDRDIAPLTSDELDEYNAFVDAVELRAVNLVSVESSISERSEGADGVSFEPTGFRTEVVETQTFYCGVRFAMEVAAGDEEGTVAEASAEYALLYEIPEESDITDKTAGLFASRTAVFNAWPFFRELVHSLVGRMGFVPLTLPLFKLPPVPTE